MKPKNTESKRIIEERDEIRIYKKSWFRISSRETNGFTGFLCETHHFLHTCWNNITKTTNHFSLSRSYLLQFRSPCRIIQGAYKLSGYFAKPYFHKYWTEIHDVTTIWKRNVCSFILFTSHHLQRHYQNCESASTPQSGMSHKICFRGFGGNGSIAWTSAVSHLGGHIECI